MSRFCHFLLFINNVAMSCDDVFAKRFSKEFIMRKNLLPSRPDCLSGVVLQSKFDSSFYCLSKNQSVGRAEKLTCLTANSLKNCECGKENPPPSSGNRIMYPTGAQY